MEISVQDISELPDAAKQILGFSAGVRVFLFEGDMGAGKTTFIKAMCDQLSVTEGVTSPTYSLVNEYDSPTGKIFHFDFFRIKSEVEAYDIGFEDYLYSGNYCFIEWPDKIKGLWPAEYIEVVIEQVEGRNRTINAKRI